MTTFRLRRDRLQWREIDGQAIVVDLPSSMYLSANPAATLLWQDLAEGATADALAARLVKTFGIESDRADTDVGAFLDALRERGLLEAVEDA